MAPWINSFMYADRPLLSDFRLTSPVALIIFNRPDTTERVFQAIAKAKPPTLLVVGDGPRAKEGERARVAATRDIINRVNWDCEVLLNYSDENLGCRKRVSSGLAWVFEKVTEAIILEDDCLPHPTFFPFCQELLVRYRNDERIAMISGDNFQLGRQRGEASYYFSKYLHIWGWASWRRAWQHYDPALSDWPKVRASNFLHSRIVNRHERQHWENAFQAVYEGRLDTWDHQWTFAAWKKGMIAAMPNVNLVSNLGFDELATHTKRRTMFAALPTKGIHFPLRHPEEVKADSSADEFTARRMFVPSFRRRIVNYITSCSG